MQQDTWPTEIRLVGDRRALAIAFEDGTHLELPAELLRVESPSAEVQGHSAAEKKLVAGKRAVRIVAVDPLGNYAVKLTFDDGHSTGIYSWPLLRDLGRRREELMGEYLARLAERGLSRG